MYILKLFSEKGILFNIKYKNSVATVFTRWSLKNVYTDFRPFFFIVYKVWAESRANKRECHGIQLLWNTTILRVCAGGQRKSVIEASSVRSWQCSNQNVFCLCTVFIFSCIWLTIRNVWTQEKSRIAISEIIWIFIKSAPNVWHIQGGENVWSILRFGLL